jgi:hypothetical protein
MVLSAVIAAVVLAENPMVMNYGGVPYEISNPSSNGALNSLSLH